MVKNKKPKNITPKTPEEKKRVQEGNKYIQERERKAAELMDKNRSLSAKAAQRKASEQIGARDRNEQIITDKQNLAQQQTVQQQKPTKIDKQIIPEPQENIISKNYPNSLPLEKTLTELGKGTVDIAETINKGVKKVSDFLNPPLPENMTAFIFPLPIGEVQEIPPPISRTRSIIGKSAEYKLERIPIKNRPVAERFAVNKKSLGLTLKKLAKISTKPEALLTIIGSYPFADFIKEEALQTLDFGVRTAEKSKDLRQMEQALNQKRELLDPNTWNQIFHMIPVVNILNEMKNFYKASWKKLQIDQKNFEKLKGGG